VLAPRLPIHLAETTAELPSSPRLYDPFMDHPRAQTAWEALAPRMAGRERVTRVPLVRLSRDGGRTYPDDSWKPQRLRKREVAVPHRLPSQPAAIRVYDELTGCASFFAMDLDVGKSLGDGGRLAVDRDYAHITALLTEAGITAWFSDQSPAGGRHIYVPLADPLPLWAAAEAATALHHRFPTLDPAPMRAIDSGCIRVPGSWHKSRGGRARGHQLLDQDLEHAVAALDHPCPAEAWSRFTALVHALPLIQPAEALPPVPAADPLHREWATEPRRAHHRDVPTDYLTIARTGTYPAQRYPSPSHARMAVVGAAVRAGLAFVDVARRVDDGTWAGLRQMYAAQGRSERRWRRLLAYEYGKARESWDTGPRPHHRAPGRGVRNVRPSITSRTPTRAGTGAEGLNGGETSAFVRSWLACVDLLYGEGALSRRALLYGLADAAGKSGSIVVEFGTRALAVATGLDAGSVSRLLRMLVAEPDDRRLLDLVSPARGVLADRYTLRIPEEHLDYVDRRSWRRGKVYGIRPVFEALGRPAAFVYAALEHFDASARRDPDAPAAFSGRAIAERAGLSEAVTLEALAAMHAHGMVEAVPGRTGGRNGWRLGQADLGRLAEAWGVVESIRDKLDRYKAQRMAWHAWLQHRGHLVVTGLARDAGVASPVPAAVLIADPACHDSLFDLSEALALLERDLGAKAV